MFPLKVRKIGGYKFGEKTWYTPHHLGVDYKASLKTKLYAPFDGKIISEINGPQGGWTLWFKPNHDNVIFRFIHLYGFEVKTLNKEVKEGTLIAYTGNTGSATTGAHLHLDISKNKVDIKNFKNFLDPEKYLWTIPDSITEWLEQPLATIVPEAKNEATSPSMTQDIHEVAPNPVTSIFEHLWDLIKKLFA